MKKYAILLLSLLALTTCESDDPIQYKLSTQVNPPAGGTISPSSGTFDKGEEITFTAKPSDEYVFKNWSDDASGNENPMTVVMTDDMFVTANFEKKTYALTIEIQGEGTVKEEIIPAKSSTDYPSGTAVQLTALPDEGWEFLKWEGPFGEVEDNPMDISITAPTKIKAIFQKLKEYNLTIEIEGQGTVKEEVVQAKSSTDYPMGTQVQLTAIPDDGWEFIMWSWPPVWSENTNPIVLNMIYDHHVIAVFKPLDKTKVFIPDDNFEQALIDLGLDDVLDDHVYLEVIKDVKELNLENRGIEDLTGIEGFGELNTLILTNNNLKTLDLSNNPYLSKLFCDRNQLTSLDISHQIGLDPGLFLATHNQLSCIQIGRIQLMSGSWIGPGAFAAAMAIDEGVTYSVDCSVSEEEKTYVPDDQFEQALIDLGLDDVLDNYVKTRSILTVSELDISSRAISDLTGMEDFKGLFVLNASNNNLTGNLDVSEWGFFILDFRNNPLSCVQVNERWLRGSLSFIFVDDGVEISADCGG